MVSTAAFHARVRGSVPGLGGLKETKLFLPHPRVKVSIVGSLRDREVACSASDRQGSNFESCVWRTVSSQSSHHPQEVLLAQFSLYVHKGGLKPDSFHFEAPPLSYLSLDRFKSDPDLMMVVDGVPTLNQHWANMLCLMGISQQEIGVLCFYVWPTLETMANIKPALCPCLLRDGLAQQT